MFSSSSFSAAPFSADAFDPNAIVQVTGVSASGFVGDVVVTGVAVVSVTGVQATDQVGDVTIYTQNIFLVTGVSATALVSSVLVWGEIDDNQTPNWQVISTPTTGTWTPAQTLGLN